MSDFTVGLVKPRTDEEYIAAIDEMLAEMQRSEIKSRERRARIKQLKAESAAIRTRSLATQARTQIRLDTLAKWVKPDVG